MGRKSIKSQIAKGEATLVKASDTPPAIFNPETAQDVLKAYEQSVMENPADALTLTRNLLSQETVGGKALPLKSEGDRLIFANNMFGAWLMYCGQHFDDLEWEVDEMIIALTHLKQTFKEYANDEAKIKIVNSLNEGMSLPDALLLHDVEYQQHVQRAECNKEYKRYHMGEADARADRFLDNLRKAESRLAEKYGVRLNSQNKPNNRPRKRSSKYKA